MRLIVRLAALGVALIILAVWFFGGPNLGWTKTSVPKNEYDPVTEITKPSYEDRFVPGVDFLAAGLALSVVLGGLSFFFRKPRG